MMGREDRRARADRPSKGIALMLFGSGLLTLNDTAMKWVVADHPVGEAVFVRGLFALLPIALIIRQSGGWGAIAWRSSLGQLVSAVLLASALFTFIFSLTLLPIAVATIVVYTNPLFVTALAPFMLRERVGWRRWSAVGIGFAGALLIVGDPGEGFSWPVTLPLVAAFLAALRDIVNRRLVAGETSVSILAFSNVVVVICALATAFWGWTELSVLDFSILAFSGLAFGLAMFCLIEALRYAEASLLSPFKYAAVLLAVALGYVIWGDVPDLNTWGGAVLIVGSGLFILWRERRVSV